MEIPSKAVQEYALSGYESYFPNLDEAVISCLHGKRQGIWLQGEHEALSLGKNLATRFGLSYVNLPQVSPMELQGAVKTCLHRAQNKSLVLGHLQHPAEAMTESVLKIWSTLLQSRLVILISSEQKVWANTCSTTISFTRPSKDQICAMACDFGLMYFAEIISERYAGEEYVQIRRYLKELCKLASKNFDGYLTKEQLYSVG